MLRKSYLITIMLLTNFLFNACIPFPQETSAKETPKGREDTAIVDKLKIPEKIPEIVIKTGRTDAPKIRYVSAINQWNGKNVKRLSLFDPEHTKDNFPDPPIFPKSENNIVVDFGEYPPEKISVIEQIIHRTESKDKLGTIRSVIFEEASEGSLKDGLGVYVYIPEIPKEIPKKKEKILTGYSITAYWGDNICEYAFLIQVVDE